MRFFRTARLLILPGIALIAGAMTLKYASLAGVVPAPPLLALGMLTGLALTLVGAITLVIAD